jgi:hemerythrin-like domain-containing protein
MTLTQVLRSEHEMIEQVLRCLRAVEETSELCESPSPAELEKLLLFLERFKSQVHHAREQLLINAARRSGDEGLFQLAERTERTHEEGARLSRLAMTALASEQCASGRWSEGTCKAVRDFVNWQGSHVIWENEQLFPTIEERLPPQQRADLQATFDQSAATTRTQIYSLQQESEEVLEAMGIPLPTDG